MATARDGHTRLFLHDGEHDFRLTLGGLRELQEKCDAGPLQIMTRLNSGEYRIDDVLQTLRIGLIGGGMEPAKAWALVERSIGTHVEASGEDSLSPRFVAASVLAAALVGPEDESVGKEEGAETQA